LRLRGEAVTPKYFALRYNNDKGTPNWVSWRATKEDLGDARRVG